jgi:hypothetical protein
MFRALDFNPSTEKKISHGCEVKLIETNLAHWILIFDLTMLYTALFSASPL